MFEFDPDGNTCECCGARPDICFLPVSHERTVILCRACTNPDELIPIRATDLPLCARCFNASAERNYDLCLECLYPNGVPVRIYQPENATVFSCEETHWRYVTPDKCMPAQLQHIPTSAIFELEMDLPEGAQTFYPLRCIYAVLVHQCPGRPVLPVDELVRIAREAMTLWLMDAGYLAITSHTEKGETSLRVRSTRR